MRATGVGGPARGYDAAKRTAGRKRHILVDAAGLVLLAHVHAADLHDRLGAQAPGRPRRRRRTATPGAGLGRWRLRRHLRALARGRARLARRGAQAPATPSLALRAGGAAEGLPGHPAALGGRAHLRVAVALATPRARLRAPARNRRSDDPRRHEPHHAPPRRRMSTLADFADGQFSPLLLGGVLLAWAGGSAAGAGCRHVTLARAASGPARRACQVGGLASMLAARRASA